MIYLVLAMQMAVNSSPPPSPPACKVIMAEQDSSGLAKLYAACGGIGVWLGVADGYRSSYNPALNSLIVVSTAHGDQRVRLVSLATDNTPHVDDITRDLTKLSGRYAEARLDVAVDISTFASDGMVSVPAPAGMPGGKALPQAPGTIVGHDRNQLDARRFVSEQR